MLPFSVAKCETEKIFKSNIASGEINLNQLKMRCHLIAVSGPDLICDTSLIRLSLKFSFVLHYQSLILTRIIFIY